MIDHASSEDMLICTQAVPVEKTPSTKRSHIEKTPDLVSPETKRTRTVVNCLSPERNRLAKATESRRSIKHMSKNYYRWNPEHLISFPWLHYDVEHATASCKLQGCKMYLLQLLESNVVVSGNILTLKPGCLTSMRILGFFKCSVVKCGTWDKLN